MDKTSLDTSTGCFICTHSLIHSGCPRHVERNYIVLFGVTQSNVDLRNYVPLFGVTQSNVDLRIFTSDCYLNIVVALDCY